MAITSTTVVNFAPELSTITSAQWTQILADVALEMDADVWGNRLDSGALRLAAHMATLTLRRGAGGQITGMTAGPVSVSYSSAAKFGTGLEATVYGAEYLRMGMSLPDARVACG